MCKNKYTQKCVKQRKCLLHLLFSSTFCTDKRQFKSLNYLIAAAILNQSLEGRAATAEFQWQRHPRAAMAAAAADAPHHIATLTLEDEDRRGATKVFGGPAAGRTERETENEREREGKGSGNECLVCGALFSSQDKLRLHAFCHAGEKPFHCSQPHCPKAFSSKYKLFRWLFDTNNVSINYRNFQCAYVHQTLTKHCFCFSFVGIWPHTPHRRLISVHFVKRCFTAKIT